MRKITIKDTQRAKLLLERKQDELENDEKGLCSAIINLYLKGKEIADVQYTAFKTLHRRIINNW